MDRHRRCCSGFGLGSPQLPTFLRSPKRTGSSGHSGLCKKTPIPKVQQSKLVRTPIDSFLLAKLEAKKLSYAKQASRTTLVRRAYLDLTGLPPTPAEIDAFTADKSSDAFERLG